MPQSLLAELRRDGTRERRVVKLTLYYDATQPPRLCSYNHPRLRLRLVPPPPGPLLDSVSRPPRVAPPHPRAYRPSHPALNPQRSRSPPPPPRLDQSHPHIPPQSPRTDFARNPLPRPPDRRAEGVHPMLQPRPQWICQVTLIPPPPCPARTASREATRAPVRPHDDFYFCTGIFKQTVAEFTIYPSRTLTTTRRRHGVPDRI